MQKAKISFLDRLNAFSLHILVFKCIAKSLEIKIKINKLTQQKMDLYTI